MAKAPSSSEEGVGGGGITRQTLLKRAAELRTNMTEPERRLWQAIRRSDLQGYKFRRQAVIGQRIVDFFCPAKGLVIEVDGETHDPSKDALRDELMFSRHGFRTSRFTNCEVMTNLDGVLARLVALLEQGADRWGGSATTPQPPPLKRRGRVAEALREAAQRLAATSDTARLDAELLMAHALGVSRSDLLLRQMDGNAPAGFAALVERRAGCEPVAHIIGRQEFYGLDFVVTPDVLIPRADSESVVETALEAAPDARRILDCGSGPGTLLLALLSQLPKAGGMGIDASDAALAIARRNAEALGLEARAEFSSADWHQPGWAEDLGRFDLVIANPPYVEDQADLAPDVRLFEPAEALFAGPDGLDDYRILVPQLPDLLTKNGVAVLEIGATQAASVSKMAQEQGFAVEVKPDLAGRDRALVLRLRLGKAESTV